MSGVAVVMVKSRHCILSTCLRNNVPSGDGPHRIRVPSPRHCHLLGNLPVKFSATTASPTLKLRRGLDESCARFWLTVSVLLSVIRLGAGCRVMNVAVVPSAGQLELPLWLCEVLTVNHQNFDSHSWMELPDMRSIALLK